ncbi:MAG: PD-(D/E)XK nuclease family protein [Bacillota bacterium]|nr:PD-(D/E)XK nuclease family protein [Bacillota bacterium]
MSCSRLNTWLRCPFQFWCEVQPELKPMVKPRPYLALGSIVHAVLRTFYTLPPDRRTRNALLRLYDQAWADQGSQPAFTGRQERERWYRQGYEMLHRYALRARPAEVNVKRLECNMYLELGEHRVSGKVDRLDHLGEGVLRVVDYKTGRSQGGEEDLAARVYPLMVWRAERETPPVRVVMVYDYLPEGERVAGEITAEAVPALEEELGRLVEQVAGDTAFLPAENQWCGPCDFRALCPEAPLDELLGRWPEDPAGRLESLAESHPLPALWTRLSQIRMFLGAYEAAERAAARAVEASPDYVLARHQLGIALATLGKQAEAVEHLRCAWQVVRPGRAGQATRTGTAGLDDRTGSAGRGSGGVARRTVEVGLALAEALLALGGGEAMGEAEDVLQQLERWGAEMAPADDARRQRLAARVALQRGAPEQARDLLLSLVTGNPYDGESYFWLAEAARRAGDAGAALDHLCRAAEHGYRSAHCYRQAAALALEGEDYHRAADLYRQALEADPGDLESREGLATCLFWAGRWEEALGAAREWQEAGGGTAARALAMDCLLRLGRQQEARAELDAICTECRPAGELARALGAVNCYLERVPGDQEVLLEKVDLADELDRPTEAGAALAALSRLARKRSGDLARARTLARLAVAACPGLAVAEEALREVLEATRQLAEADAAEKGRPLAELLAEEEARLPLEGMRVAVVGGDRVGAGPYRDAFAQLGAECRFVSADLNPAHVRDKVAGCDAVVIVAAEIGHDLSEQTVRVARSLGIPVVLPGRMRGARAVASAAALQLPAR